jgi:tRNA (guanine9-N1)-methyltransferase
VYQQRANHFDHTNAHYLLQLLCSNKAKSLGIKTAKLPIDPDRLNASTVLTVNQVVEILIAFNETLDWASTMERCLPKRKTKEQAAKQAPVAEECADN